VKLLKQVWRFIFGPPPTEIELVEAALVRYYDKRASIEKQWRKAGGLCCPSCFSYEYVWLTNKIDRVETWLAVLKKRKNKNEKKNI